MVKYITRRNVVIAVIVVLSLIIGINWFRNAQKPAYGQDDIFTVKRTSLRETLSLSGFVNADEFAQVKFLASGRITFTGPKEGDVVSSGQTLASLDQRELQKQFQQSLNTYKKTRNTFDQAADDNEEWGAYEPEVADSMRRLVDNAQQDLDNSVINVELQQLAFEYAHIYSPINGVVVNSPNLYPGSNVTAGEIAYEVLNPSTIYFSATADQSEVVKLSEGIQGDLILDSYAEDETTGSITSIGYTPKINEVGTVYEVKVSLNDPSKLSRLRIGMTGDITFTLNEKADSIAIPVEYLQLDEEGSPYVYKLVDGKPVETPVETGMDTGEMVEVLEGLNENDQVIAEVE